VNTANLELECLTQSVARRGAASHVGNENNGHTSNLSRTTQSSALAWVNASLVSNLEHYDGCHSVQQIRDARSAL
jgi:hypothetical protein